jgi:hypothetical protein
MNGAVHPTSPNMHIGMLLAAALLSLAAYPASARDLPPLTTYEGKYPHDDAPQPPFLRHPLVRQAVERAVPDAELRQRILAPDGPKTPIWIAEGRIHSWGCETHLCGAHNWMISMRFDGSASEVCYHDASSTDAGARWYHEGKSEIREYQCPSEKPEGA